jgi:hypothetical protein
MSLGSSSRVQLIGAARRGGITLVLGSGISVSCGIPNWEKLAKAMWQVAFADEISPWQTGTSPGEVPQFLPIVFELVYRSLGQEKFITELKERLYVDCTYPADRVSQLRRSNQSLAVLARLLVQEHARGSRRRIDAVITLNADDLLEQAVRIAGTSHAEQEVVRTVSRSTHSFMGGPFRRPLPVYHVHGFLPAGSGRYGRFSDHMLVFTDEQYWSVSASGGSFANRIMLSALGESRCIFIGLSMTDVNLLRWLGSHGLEKDHDVIAASGNPGLQSMMSRDMFGRHFWVRPASDDPSGFLSRFLEIRGVHSVKIKAWGGRSFRNLMEACFPV